MVRREYLVTSTHTYKVRLEFDPKKYNGDELAVQAVQYLDPDDLTISDEGDEGLMSAGYFDLESGLPTISVEDLLEAGVDEENVLKSSFSCPE